jgi:D-sedoheptulose 7-phosphate isomerase
MKQEKRQPSGKQSRDPDSSVPAPELSAPMLSAVIEQQIDDGIALRKELRGKIDMIIAIARAWTRSLKGGGKILLFGNGGSAADAQHLAAELAGKFYLDREPLAAIALTTDTSVLTALGNDLGFENVFARQVQALARQGDVVVGISTSGNSPDVLRAIEYAKEKGIFTVAFTGAGGKLVEMADLVLSIPSRDTPRIQEAHITAGHLVCYLVERSLFGKS